MRHGMATEHDVLQFKDLAAQIEAWKDRFVSDVGIAKNRRAAAWAMDETAKHAAIGIRSQFDKRLKSEVPQTKQAVAYRRSGKASLNAIEAGEREIFSSVYVMPKQSAYFKYLFGIGDNIRLPGDLGLAQEHILMLFWKNITETRGVTPTRYGGIPSGFFACLRREAETGKRGATSRWSVFPWPDQDPRPDASRLRRQAAARRPRRTTDDQHQERSEDRRPQDGRPRQDAHPVPGRAQATYKPKLEHPWTGAVEAAALRIPDIMQAQLADNVRHRGTSRAAAGNIINWSPKSLPMPRRLAT
jgi:hypothetical protein